jgi:hypothetical protein
MAGLWLAMGVAANNALFTDLKFRSLLRFTSLLYFHDLFSRTTPTREQGHRGQGFADGRSFIRWQSQNPS